jgi:hypothetical protein
MSALKAQGETGWLHTGETVRYPDILANVFTKQYTDNTLPGSLGRASVMICDREEY